MPHFAVQYTPKHLSENPDNPPDYSVYKEKNRGASMNRYPRDMIGYGAHPPDPKWPDKARIAVQFVLTGIAASGLIPQS